MLGPCIFYEFEVLNAAREVPNRANEVPNAARKARNSTREVQNSASEVPSAVRLTGQHSGPFFLSILNALWIVINQPI